MGVNFPSIKTHRPTQGLVVHRNSGVHTRFLVVHTPQDLRFALVWGEFQHKVRHFRQDFVSYSQHLTVSGGLLSDSGGGVWVRAGGGARKNAVHFKPPKRPLVRAAER